MPFEAKECFVVERAQYEISSSEAPYTRYLVDEILRHIVPIGPGDPLENSGGLLFGVTESAHRRTCPNQGICKVPSGEAVGHSC
jgi:hypothetical protein